MKPWMNFAIILAIIAALIIAGCTEKVNASEKDKPIFVIDEQQCSGIISINVVTVDADNRGALTAGLREVEKTHKIIFWTSKQSALYSGFTPTSGYDVYVEVNESCRR